MSDPLLLDFATAAVRLGVGKTLLYEMAADGRLGPVPIKFGRRSLICAAELESWTAAGCPPRARWIAMREGGGR